jgi:hypothetical protein
MSPTATATLVSTNTHPDGTLLMSWGEPGTGEGEFNIVDNICCDADGWVYVADRENHRVQVSTATASTKRSGRTCTARAASTAKPPWVRQPAKKGAPSRA